MANDTDQIALIVKEVLQLVGQQGTQQSSQQVAEAVQQAIQKVQGSSQEKASSIERNASSENKQEEINTGEAFRSNVYTKTRLWDFDDKLIAASELSERVRSLDQDLAMKALAIKDKEIEVARKQHDFAIAQQLDHLKIIGAQNVANFNTAVQFEYAKFNNASSHPISPNDSDKDAKK